MFCFLAKQLIVDLNKSRFSFLSFSLQFRVFPSFRFRHLETGLINSETWLNQVDEVHPLCFTLKRRTSAGFRVQIFHAIHKIRFSAWRTNPLCVLTISTQWLAFLKHFKCRLHLKLSRYL